MLAVPSECVQNPSISHTSMLPPWSKAPARLTWITAVCSQPVSLLLPLSVCGLFSTQQIEWCFWNISQLRWKTCKGSLSLSQSQIQSPHCGPQNHPLCSPSHALWSRHTSLFAFVCTWQNTPAPGPLHYLFLSESHMTGVSSFKSLFRYHIIVMLITSFKRQAFSQASCSVFST